MDDRAQTHEKHTLHTNFSVNSQGFWAANASKFVVSSGRMEDAVINNARSSKLYLTSPEYCDSQRDASFFPWNSRMALADFKHKE